MRKKLTLEEGLVVKPETSSTAIKGAISTKSGDEKLHVYLDGADRSIVTEDQAQTLSNKSIDADTNPISNLETDNLKSGVLNTSTTLSGATNTQIPSALAAKTYAEDLATSVQDNLDAHIADTVDAHDASAISVIPVGNLTSTDGQSAFAELDSEITTVASDLAAHINDTTDAHDASAISTTPISGVTGTDVQAMLANLKTQIDTKGTGNGDVTGPASSTDNALARFDGTTGKLIQNSTVSLSDTGVVSGMSIDADTNTITNIENADIKAGAAIDAAKIADGSVSNTEFQYLDGVTSSIQTQLNGKQSLLVNSAGLAAALSDETGNGLAVFNNQPTITNASIQTPSRLDAKQDTLANLTTYALTATNGQFVFSTDTKETFVVKDGQLSSVAGSNSGGINYIINYTADTNTNGWVAYADAAGTSPVDGTGGTPASTYTRSTSAPLRGTASFVWTKSAANRQGEGFSYDFTIDSADTGKVLQGYFDYQISSGTFADNDMSVWIYDVTNARLIQPAPYLLKNSGIIERFPFEFQTAINSTSYRLIVHTGSTSALAYTLKFDNFNVGPQAKLYGSAITDPIDYTPTISPNTNAVCTGKWHKEGKYLVVDGRVDWTGTGSVLQFSYTLPSGLNVDTSALPTISSQRTLIGKGSGLQNGIQSTEVIVVYNNATSVVVTGSVTGTSATNKLAFDGNLFTAAPTSGSFLNFSFKVPIQGWSSSQVMSSDANTRVVAAIVNGNPANTSANGIVIFPTVQRDTHAAYNSTTGRYTVPTEGFYKIETFLYGASGAGGIIQAYVDGVGITPAIGTISTAVTGGGSVTVYARAGQLLDIRCSNALTGLTAFNGVSFTRVSGPSQIAASESISVRATQSSGQSIANTGVGIDLTWNNVTYDSHGAFNGSTGEFTAPISGKYKVTSRIRYASNSWTASNEASLVLSKGGVTYSVIGDTRAWATISVEMNVNGSDTIALLQGEKIKVQAISTRSGGSTSLSTSGTVNFLTIERVGNY